MDFKEKAKDVGKHIIGRGDEVRFKNEVLEHASSTGISTEEAQKVIFIKRMSNVQTEIATNRIIDSSSQEFKEFRAAAREIFGEKELEQFSINATSPHIFRPIHTPPSTPAEINSVQSYYSARFGGRAPEHGVLRNSSDCTKSIDVLMGRATLDYGTIPAGTSLETEISRRPELGADIGKILDMDDSVKRHEKRFDKDLKFERTMEEAKGTWEESLKEMFWNAPKECFVNILKVGFSKDAGVGTFVYAFFQQNIILAKRELVGGAKFFGATVNVLGSLLKNKAIR